MFQSWVALKALAVAYVGFMLGAFIGPLLLAAVGIAAVYVSGSAALANLILFYDNPDNMFLIAFPSGLLFAVIAALIVWRIRSKARTRAINLQRVDQALTQPQ